MPRWKHQIDGGSIGRGGLFNHLPRHQWLAEQPSDEVESVNPQGRYRLGAGWALSNGLPPVMDRTNLAQQALDARRLKVFDGVMVAKNVAHNQDRVFLE